MILNTLLVLCIIFMAICVLVLIMQSRRKKAFRARISNHIEKATEELKKTNFAVSVEHHLKTDYPNLGGLITLQTKSFYVDTANKRLAFVNLFPAYSLEYLNFDEIKNYDVIVIDGGGKANSITSGVATPYGGALGSTSTTITNYINSVKLKITLNNIENPEYIFTVQSFRSPSNGAYRQTSAFVETIKSTLDNIIVKDAPVAEPVANISSADELKKYKALLEDGIITAEEFEAKKKQLLNL